MQIRFGGVLPIVGPKSQVDAVLNRLQAKSKGTDDSYLTADMTEVYKAGRTKGPLAQAAQKGNSVVLMVYGDDFPKAWYTEHGWTTANGYSHHISEKPLIVKNLRPALQQLRNRAAQYHPES